MIDIIGAPFDLCGKRPGTRLGPAAVRLAGLAQVLCDLGFEVCDLKDMPFNETPGPGTGIKCFEEAHQALAEIRQCVIRSLKGGHTPLVIGGDHSIAIGAIGGALEAVGEELSVFWMDAHSDLNTPSTSPSGNLHGMVIGALTGRPGGTTGEVDRQWNKLAPHPSLKQDHVAFFGIRELDRGEQQALAGMHGAYTSTMHEVDRHGIVMSMQRFDHWMRASGSKHLWVSFDVDVLDPFLAPGTGTAVRGGLSYREAHLVAELLRELLDTPGCPYKLVGLDVVEVNPLFDSRNETAITAVEWIGSLFGKTILGKR